MDIFWNVHFPTFYRSIVAVWPEVNEEPEVNGEPETKKGPEIERYSFGVPLICFGTIGWRE